MLLLLLLLLALFADGALGAIHCQCKQTGGQMRNSSPAPSAASAAPSAAGGAACAVCCGVSMLSLKPNKLHLLICTHTFLQHHTYTLHSLTLCVAHDQRGLQVVAGACVIGVGLVAAGIRLGQRPALAAQPVRICRAELRLLAEHAPHDYVCTVWGGSLWGWGGSYVWQTIYDWWW